MNQGAQAAPGATGFASQNPVEQEWQIRGQ